MGPSGENLSSSNETKTFNNQKNTQNVNKKKWDGRLATRMCVDKMYVLYDYGQ